MSEDLQRTISELALLNEIAIDLSTAADLDSALHLLVHKVVKEINCSQGTVVLTENASVESGNHTLIREMSRTVSDPLRLADSLIEWVATSRQPIRKEVGEDSPIGMLGNRTIRSVLAVPIVIHSRAIGVLVLFNKKGNTPFQAGDERLLSIVAAHSAQLIMHKKLNEERTRIMDLLGQHTSNHIVEELLRVNYEFESKRQNACILFVDIRRFSSMSENVDPALVMYFLNELLGSMIDIVHTNSGFVHKLLGDGFMAVFGIPMESKRCCADGLRAAQQIARAVSNREMRFEGYPIELGLGLHYGPVVTGLIGSEGHSEYQIVGDTVNVASRIESLNKLLDSTLLCSGALYDQLNDEQLQSTCFCSHGDVELRGRSQKERVYEVEL